jgi:CRP/FNR family transcriptional regulator, anaerobic regulatory protein
MCPNTNVVSISGIRIACKDCSLFQLCLPIGVGEADIELLDRIIKRRRPLRRGEHLFHVGDPFQAIYAVRSGSIKTYTPTDDGHEQVIGFHLPGELAGLDAINGDVHPCAAKALETTSVCEIPFARLEELSDRVPSLQRQLLRVLSKEILHDHKLLMLISKKAAEERLAALLVSLSARFHRRGFSATEFHLSMSRNDMGNYLGLAVETVSRLFTRFQDEGLLKVQRKHVCLLDLQRLHRMAGVPEGAAGA